MPKGMRTRSESEAFAVFKSVTPTQKAPKWSLCFGRSDEVTPLRFVMPLWGMRTRSESEAFAVFKSATPTQKAPNGAFVLVGVT